MYTKYPFSIHSLKDVYKLMTKEEIIKIITENTEYWQPRGEKDSCFIIEDEGLLWRINPKWAEEIADKIINE